MQQKAVVTFPTKVKPGDRVFTGGRGPWGRVTEVCPARGRPPLTGPRVKIVTTRGERILGVADPVRVIRARQ